METSHWSPEVRRIVGMEDVKHSPNHNFHVNKLFRGLISLLIAYFIYHYAYDYFYFDSGLQRDSVSFLSKYIPKNGAETIGEIISISVMFLIGIMPIYGAYKFITFDKYIHDFDYSSLNKSKIEIKEAVRFIGAADIWNPDNRAWEKPVWERPTGMQDDDEFEYIEQVPLTTEESIYEKNCKEYRNMAAYDRYLNTVIYPGPSEKAVPIFNATRGSMEMMHRDNLTEGENKLLKYLNINVGCRNSVDATQWFLNRGIDKK